MDFSNRSQGSRRGAVKGVSTSATTGTSTHTTGITRTSHQHSDQVAAAAASASLQLLLREDSLLQPLTETHKQPDTVAFPYAAALLKQDNHAAAAASTTAQQRATLALQDVERKLALVESLAVKLSRTSPEAVAGHLLRLHGHGHGHAQQTPPPDSNTSATTTNTTTLQAIRDRADRLERQADTMETVARRVEGSLQRGLVRMQTACTKLERVLETSSTLKRILQWQFENRKLQNYDLDDLRDLTRAAASVAVLEELAATTAKPPIHVVEELRPQAQATAKAVRQAAAKLLQGKGTTSETTIANAGATQIQQLGATLQVYYHLGELPSAVWKAVNDAHQQAEAVSRQLWNPVSLANLTEQAKKQKSNHAKRQLRAQAASEWAEGIAQAASQVRNLQRVLAFKTDPVRRQVYLDVVARAQVPTEYASARDKQKQQNKHTFGLFALFWTHWCDSLAQTIQSVLAYEKGKFLPEVSALYPAVRASALQLMARLLENSAVANSGSSSGAAMSGVSSSHLEDSTGANEAAGILGGTLGLLEDDMLLLQEPQQEISAPETKQDESNPQAAADSWTRPASHGAAMAASSRVTTSASGSATSLAVVCSSSEWQNLETKGLHQLEKAFLLSVRQRLDAPLRYMFPENVTLDDNGVAISTGMTLLPSKYDVQRFDENIRSELSLADPREGGGDMSAVTMIAECVVGMIADFCVRARQAMAGASDAYLDASSWGMTENLQHDRKVVAIMYTLGNYLKNAPEKTFVAPYRPAILTQHEEAASLCQVALTPARENIDRVVKLAVLDPLCKALNRQLTIVLSRILHHGVYLESSNYNADAEQDEPAFVQKHLAPVFDAVAKNLLSKFPPPYSAKLAATVTTFTIFTFVSNLSLVRPLGESSRLHMTQDLADLELTLEQFISKSGGGAVLSQIQDGKPYAELRAVRQMLFWTGLEMKTTAAAEIAKSLLREPWIKDVRPSTIFHYLFASGPSLLSSPHHTKRLKAAEYVQTLVELDGTIQEDNAWMTVVACCDAYQQRATSGAVNSDGDERVAEVVLTLGPELLRRRRH